MPAIARRWFSGRFSIAFHASLARFGLIAVAWIVREIGCPAPRTCSIAFAFSGILLGSKARIVEMLSRVFLFKAVVGRKILKFCLSRGLRGGKNRPSVHSPTAIF